MVPRALAGVALVFLLAPAGSLTRREPSGSPRGAPAPALSRRPDAGSEDGEWVHAIARGRRERPLGIVQA